MGCRRGPTSARLAICLIVPGANGEVDGATRRATAPRDRSLIAAGLPSLAALTPVGHEVTLIHDDGAPLDWARLCRHYDVIALTGTLRQRERLLEIIGRRRGGAATICVAGPIVADDEPSLERLCDVRFVGPLEETWPRFVDDVAAGRRTLRRYQPAEVSWLAALAGLASRWQRRAGAPALAAR